jgi:uncharacterized protein
MDPLEARLHEHLTSLGSVAIAFSGGVDSSVLLHAAQRALGDRAMAVIADSPSLPRRELAEARELARELGVRLEVVQTDELTDPDYVANAGDRCYFCKSALFRAMERVAEVTNVAYLAFGEITDDLSDDRPGARAAGERGVAAPLRVCGFSKADVRAYARRYRLPVAAKPASACLASRIPAGTRVTVERLARVERAEDALLDLGLRVLRVRDRGERARVEVGADELAHATEQSAAIDGALRAVGFDGFELEVYRAPGASAP